MDASPLNAARETYLMGGADDTGHDPRHDPPSNDRLESWKEIATHVGKDVKTVQRWEKRAGLPVHRHTEGRVLNVHAYRSEIDTWRDQHRAQRGNDDGGQGVSVNSEASDTWGNATRTWTSWPVLVTGSLIAIVLVASLTWVTLTRRAEPGLGLAESFHEGNYVLITQFENLTGDPLFDGTLEYALERELSESSFVRVAPSDRVRDALRLMKVPEDTAVNATIGREAALRDDGIRAILTGRIEKLGPSFVLSVQLVDPQDGGVVASVSEDASGERTLVSAVRRQASQVRAALGEALPLIEASDQRLERVTTPSLRALQLYSQAYDVYRFGGRSQKPVAAGLFQEAIAADPDFAAAHNMLGWSIRSQGPVDADEYLPHFERAVALATGSTEADRLFIEGSYYTVTEQYETAVPKYEALLDVQPGHYYAVNNLVFARGALGLLTDTAALTAQRADQRPNDHGSQLQAAHQLTVAWQIERAKVYLSRARTLITPESTVSMPQLAQMDFFPAYAHWFRGELDEAIREIEAVSGTIPERTSATGSDRTSQDALYATAGNFYVALGQLQRAKTSFERIREANARHYFLGWLAYDLSDLAGLRDHLHLVSDGRYPVPLTAPRPFEVVWAGLDPESFAYGPRPPSTADWDLAGGELARQRGETSDAIERLEQGIQGPQLRELSHQDFYRGSESLATAWQELGEDTQALRVLEEAAQVRARYFFGQVVGAFGRSRIQARLAREYRKLGRNDDAEAIETDMLRMLRYADDDHPIVRYIQESQTSNP